jgi:precorrin-6A/cobalt-precorrin-6A reductase
VRVLLLGGTGEARVLAARLHCTSGVEVISSLAGRVRDPHLPPGHVRLGGFGGPRELAAYLTAERIDTLVDATHPFAAQITANAAIACELAGVELLVLRRPGWQPAIGDRWQRVASLVQAAAVVAALPAGTVLLTTGRRQLAAFAADAEHHYVIRTVDPPDEPLPPHATLLAARGPFHTDDEITLLRRYDVTALVTKDSGGTMTSAKLTAARRLQVPVVMIDRPPLPPGVRLVHTVEQAEQLIAATTRCPAGPGGQRPSGA